MSYKITIEKLTIEPSSSASDVTHEVATEIFSQTVDSLNLKAVINTINATPRKPRTLKAKS